MLEADDSAAIAALEAAAGSEVFPVAPVPLDTAVRADLDDSFRGVRYLEVVDRATALHELAPPAAELLHAAELAADLEHLRAERSALLAARAEAERNAAIAASQPTVDRLRELPSRFMLPRRRGDDMRAEAGRVTAADLISELLAGEHADRLDELDVLIGLAEKRRSMGARW